MPQVGEQRTFDGRLAEWDGKGWKPVDPVTEGPGPVQRFVEGAIRANPVTNAVDFLGGMLTDPKGTGTNVVNASVDRLQRASQASQEGRPAAALGNALAATPLVGPYVGNAVDRMQGGDVAGGLGELSWLGLPALKSGASAAGAGALDLAKRTPLAGPMNTLADTLDTAATDKLTRFASPQVGPNKVRLGNRMAGVAPDLLRDPGLSAVTRTGLADKLGARLDQATEGLDTAADARLASQQVKTGPIVAALTKQIDALTASPVDAAKYPQTRLPPPPVSRGEQVAGITGELSPSQVAKPEPYGQSVEPAPNTSQIATLKKMRDEVSALGSVAPYEAIRRIRQAWDQVARVKYNPATSQDFLSKQGEASGAASGTAALREGLATTDPQSAATYKTYSLYKTANDVIQAAEEADRVRPNRGRGIMARTTGAVVGAGQGGAVGAGIGATVASIADKASEMAPSFQVAIARRLAGAADALRSGDAPGAQVIVDRIVHQFPAITTGLKVGGRAAAMLGRDLQNAPLAATNQDEPK